MVGGVGWGPLQRPPGGRQAAAHILSLNINTKGPHSRHQKLLPFIFSLLIGYRVQALTVVKPSEERARRSAQRVAAWGPPHGGGLVGSREAPHSLPTHSAPSPSHPGDPGEGSGGRKKTARPAELRVPDLAKAPLAAEGGPCG